MERNALVAAMAISIVNGIFSPWVLAVFLLYPVWFPSWAPPLAQLVYMASALILSTLTVMLSGIPTALYVHPRDFDSRQPRIQLPAMRTFRSYVGLASAERKLRSVLRSFSWTSAGTWIDKYGEAVRARVLDVRDAARAGPALVDSDLSPPPGPSLPPHRS